MNRVSEKKCTKCGEVKDLDEGFYKDKSTKDQHTSWCKQCQKRYREENKEKIRAYTKTEEYKKRRKDKRSENIDETQMKDNKYYQKNKETIKAQRKERYRGEVRQKRLASGRKYTEKHREEINARVKGRRKQNLERERTRDKKKRHATRSTLKGRLTTQLGNAIRNSIGKNKNGHHWEKLVGYTLNDLIKRLKKTLPENHTWQDFMEGKFHIDHILPVSAFNFEKPEDIDFKRCWSLKNLQLLPVEENLSKANKLGRHFQPSFIFGGI